MKYMSVYIMALISLNSCKKFVDIDPPETQLIATTVFSSDQTATAAQLAIYTKMEADGLAYQQQLYPGLSADEFINYSTGVFSIDLASNNLTADNSIVAGLWNNYYKYIYQANAVLEGLSNSNSVSEPIKKQLTAEAKFVRAFCHYYLLSLFGDVPYVSSADYRVNSVLSRRPSAEVLSLIETDLLAATNGLSANYLDAANNTTTERVRPNLNAAKALLSRVYLTTKNWSQAEAQATSVITAGYQILANLDQVFLKNSTEAIWQLQSVVPNYNSYPGAQLILLTTPTVAALDTNFYKAFALIDKRKTNWIKSLVVGGKTYYYPYKYKVRQNVASITEYSMVLRLSEQYLIRAEARLQQGNNSGAEQDLNIIRARAGLPAISGLPATQLMDSINKERRFELFAEFGDRWINLRRTGTINLLAALKGSSWSANDALYPIPLTELNRNPNLVQNPGY